MPLFSKTFLKKLLNLALESRGLDLDSQESAPTLAESTTQLFKGSSLIDAGDIVFFNYQDQERLVFLAKARGGSGMYTTPQHNTVLSGFLVNDVAVEVILSTLSGLYNNAERAGFPVRSMFTYKTLQGLSRIFKSVNFRTFMTQRINGHINQINIETGEIVSTIDPAEFDED